MKKRIIIPYIGWLSHQNLGDEIVFDILIEMIKEVLNVRDSCCLSFSDEESWISNSFSWTQAAGAFLGGGSTIDMYYLKKISPCIKMKKPIFAWTSGFQIDRALTPEEISVLELVNSIKHGALRGELTSNKLKELFGYNTDLPYFGDVGLLASRFFNPYDYLPLDTDGLIEFISNSDDTIYSFTPHGLDESLDFSVFEFLSSLGFSKCILQPVDPASLKACHKIREKFPNVLFYVNEDFLNYRKVLYLYSISSFSINLRLHSGILCHSMDKISYSISGGIKFDDYYKSVKQHGCRLRSLNELIKCDLGFKTVSFVDLRAKLYENLKKALMAFFDEVFKPYNLYYCSDFCLEIHRSVDKAFIVINN